MYYFEYRIVNLANDYLSLRLCFCYQDSGIDIGDIAERKALRKRLQCKTFRWYLVNIYPEMRMYTDTIAYGVVSIYIKPNQAEAIAKTLSPQKEQIKSSTTVQIAVYFVRLIHSPSAAVLSGIKLCCNKTLQVKRLVQSEQAAAETLSLHKANALTAGSAEC